VVVHERASSLSALSLPSRKREEDESKQPLKFDFVNQKKGERLE
jgi:hypothetical protein